METVRTRSGREFILPTPEEDAAITAAALEDPDARPFTDAELIEARAKSNGGRPRTPTPRKNICIRLSPDVAEAFRATGKGWQTRMNAALADWLKTHSPGDLTLG
ncbi:MAG: BrnA antitoxin family protein [Candidatus Accumulibacter sp.]|jgi:uncharacterized protein (DUF4415 family)|nr:BrnA antitoxin family protein [Accumulibacter sp.]